MIEATRPAAPLERGENHRGEDATFTPQWKSTRNLARKSHFTSALIENKNTVAGRSTWTQAELEDVLDSRFLRSGVRLNMQEPMTESWQGTTKTATVMIRGGRSEPEEEPYGEEEDEDDGAI
jgi:hypothetical protein